MKDGKAVGCDKVTAESIKNLGTTKTKEQTKICQKINNERIWPDDFLKTALISTERKKGAADCSDFMTISLLNHASKIVLGILKTKMTSKEDDHFGED